MLLKGWNRSTSACSRHPSSRKESAIEDDQKVYEVDSTEQYSDNQPDVAEAENPFTPPAIEAPKNEIQPVPEVETLEELDIMEE